MNISSAVIKSAPEYLNTLLQELKQSDICEVHYHNESQIVVTIEGQDIHEEMNKMKTIQAMEHVYSAQLMYSYSEEEISEAIEKLEKDQDAVPDVLKYDVATENIKYQGDINKINGI